MSDGFRGRFSSTYSSAVAARRAVMVFVNSFGFSAEFVADVESAVGEALANAAEHGHRDGADFDVRAAIEDDALIIDVHDQGPGFPYPADANGGAPPSGSPRGFGLYIMRSLVDEIAFSDRGRRVRLKKRLPESASIEDDRSANG